MSLWTLNVRCRNCDAQREYSHLLVGPESPRVRAVLERAGREVHESYGGAPLSCVYAMAEAEPVIVCEWLNEDAEAVAKALGGS